MRRPDACAKRHASRSATRAAASPLDLAWRRMPCNNYRSVISEAKRDCSRTKHNVLQDGSTHYNDVTLHVVQMDGAAYRDCSSNSRILRQNSTLVLSPTISSLCSSPNEDAVGDSIVTFMFQCYSNATARHCPLQFLAAWPCPTLNSVPFVLHVARCQACGWLIPKRGLRAYRGIYLLDAAAPAPLLVPNICLQLVTT